MYVPAYLDEDEERALLAAVDREPWRTTWQRRTQHYGYGYGEAGSRFEVPERLGPLPGWAAPLAERLAADGLLARVPDNLVVNEYLPGQGIAPHVDVAPYDRVVSVSLGGACVMDFVPGSSPGALAGPPGGAQAVPPGGAQRVVPGDAHALLLEPRSALGLSGEARRDWRHGIARRKSDRWRGLRFARTRRVSLTFRTLARAPR